MEAGDAASAGMGAAFEDLAGHLSGEHAEFLARWLRLVDLEEGCPSARRSEILAMPGQRSLTTTNCHTSQSHSVDLLGLLGARC